MLVLMIMIMIESIFGLLLVGRSSLIKNPYGRKRL
jgi:hypothetical protein